MEKTLYFIYLALLTSSMMGTTKADAQTVLAGDSICVANGYVLSTAFNNISCFGQATGVATVSSTGCQCMFSGCTFAWSNGETVHTADSLAANTYTVTVTHPNGCIISTNVTVSQPEAFIEAITVNNTSCPNNQDASLQVIPSATAGNLTYLWSNGSTSASINNLGTGIYTVTVTNALGCSHTESRQITAPTAPQINSSSKGTCQGANTGNAAVTLTNGFPPFTYLWSDPTNCTEATAENLAAGSYTVTITDANGCTFVKNNIVVSTSIPPIAASAASTQVCSGQTVQLNAAGGNTYAWSPAEGLSNPNIPNPIATITANSTYVVTVTDANNCTNSAAVWISAKASPVPIINPTTPIICGGNSIQLVAGNVSGASYQWTPSTGLSNSNVNAPLASPNQTTTYTVVATSSNGCSGSTQVTVTVCAVGIDDVTENTILVYPNPTEAGFYVTITDMSSNSVLMQLYDVTGKLAKADEYIANGKLTQYISTNDLASGLYYLTLKSKNLNYSQKLVVR